MLFKQLPLAALVGYAFAQGNSQSLNATLSGQQELSSLAQLLSGNPSLVNSLSRARNITILAPSNQAIERAAQVPGFSAIASNPELLASVLLYHVLNGTVRAADIKNTPTFVPTYLTRNFTTSKVTEGQVVEAVMQGNQASFYSGLMSRANVTKADLNFTGGVIHIIDSGLSPPVDLAETASAFNLTAFAGALNATNLTTALSNQPDLTIFAPNNEAFANINSAVGQLNQQTLVNTLSYHVINGTVGYSTGLTNGQNLTTASGQNITVTIRNGTVFVNQARVVMPNVLVGNGVIHIIDGVLNPTNATTPATGATSGAVAYPSASRSGDVVPFTSGQPTPTRTVNPATAAPTPAATTSQGGATQSQGAAARPLATGVGYSVALGVAAAWFL